MQGGVSHDNIRNDRDRHRRGYADKMVSEIGGQAGRGMTMIYRIRRVEIDGAGNIVNERKRCETFVSSAEYRLGALVFLKQGKLYRIEGKK